METIFEMKDDILIAKLFGEIDHHVAEKIRTDIDKTMDMYKAKNLVFDFAKVSFMDSSGVGIVLGRFKKINTKDGQVVICGCDKFVERILYMSGVFSLIKKVDNGELAIEEISNIEIGESHER